VTLLAEDQDHVVVSGPVTDKDEVVIGGISALRGSFGVPAQIIANGLRA